VLVVSVNDVIVAFVTSALSVKSAGDLSLVKSGQNGLKKNSVLKLSKLATSSKTLIAGSIGSFSVEELAEVNHGLRELFQI